MAAIYYTEINLICIIGLLMLIVLLHQQHGQGSAEGYIFRLMLVACIFLCLADMAAGILRGRTFKTVRTLLEISNIIYYVMITVIGYLWTLFVNARLNNSSRLKTLLWAIPMVVVTAVAVSNYWTDLLFSLNEENMYVRESGIYLHWIVSWLYLVIPTVKIGRHIMAEENRSRRHELHILLYFIIGPATAAIIQMIFYGVSCFQVGLLISLFIVFLADQNNQILTDTLTGLNNRRGLSRYIDEFVRHHEGKELFVMMIDLDNFKKINDRLSHFIGDQALKQTAALLKAVCGRHGSGLFLCRYGGDEFVIAGSSSDQHFLPQLERSLDDEFKAAAEKTTEPYSLSVSIGTASGIVGRSEDAIALLKQADKQMYAEKKRTKAQSFIRFDKWR